MTDDRTPLRPVARAFLHVPKCAGSSVISALQAAFPPESRAPQYFDDATFGLDADYDALQPEMRAMIAVGERERASLARYPLVCGHFVLPTLLGIAQPERIVTVLREPRARLLSLYAYWALQDLPHVRPYAPQKHAERPLGEFLGEPTLASAVDNQLCRMVLHGDPRLPSGGFIDAANGQSLAADAVAALEPLGFVGIHERPEEMWKGLAEVFGVELVPVRVNVTDELQGIPRCPPPAHSLDVRTLELLDDRTQVDRRIYAHFVRRGGDGADTSALFAEAALARQWLALGSLVARC